MISRRALFGVAAGGAAAPFVKAESASSFPLRGSEPCTLSWFNKRRGFGMAYGERSGHSILIGGQCFRRAELVPRLGERYLVLWEVKPGSYEHPAAYEIEKW